MKLIVFAAAALAAGLCAPAALAQSKTDLAAVRDTSVVDQTGARLLRDTVTIQAPPAAVWTALTNQAAYRAWAAPQSYIDFRVGGLVEVAFTPGGRPGDPANLKQQIVAYVPERLLVFRNLPSQGGPPGAAAYPKLAIVMELAARPDGGTEVSLSQVGYGTGADFDALYGF
ncbi:MAG TPA: SRPBCC domain-containing protein, partial [Phenylobacterium sp.]